MTDYWVNDRAGKPFFVLEVDRPVDQGMIEALRSDIVPRLLADVPGQPTEEELERKRRALKSKHTHRTSRYAAIDLNADLKEKDVSKWERQKAELVLEIEPIENDLEQLKARLADTPKG